MLCCNVSDGRAADLVYILGTMFKADSRIAGEILNTPEAYRQKLSRIRRKVAEFLKEYCGLAGGRCSCKKRVNYAPQHTALIRSGWSIGFVKRTACRPGITCRQWSR